MKRRIVSLLGAVGAVGFAAAAWPACSGDGGQVTPSDAGAGEVAEGGDTRDADALGDAASDAEIQSVWDPV